MLLLAVLHDFVFKYCLGLSKLLIDTLLVDSFLVVHLFFFLVVQEDVLNVAIQVHSFEGINLDLLFAHLLFFIVLGHCLWVHGEAHRVEI